LGVENVPVAGNKGKLDVSLNEIGWILEKAEAEGLQSSLEGEGRG
jgi:hypothetical protein